MCARAWVGETVPACTYVGSGGCMCTSVSASPSLTESTAQEEEAERAGGGKRQQTFGHLPALLGFNQTYSLIKAPLRFQTPASM